MTHCSSENCDAPPRIKGRTKHPLYLTWMGMRVRCYQPKDVSFKYYGGRGIDVCDEWLHSFEAFVNDMGDRPSPKHSLDRIDNDKGYSKDNCRWATWKVQASNKRIKNLYK